MGNVNRANEEGGIGLRRLDMMNKACIIKLGWKMYDKPDEQ